MRKKILLALGAVLAVAAGVAALSAYEAHVINVTAHIENALDVHPLKIEFGTVFPQEFVERDFTIDLSTSFLAEERVDDVVYVINQKPKPIWPQTYECETYCGVTWDNIDEARVYCHANPDDLICCYRSLCPFLSKLDGDPGDGNDTEVLSYYDDNGTPDDPTDDSCSTPSGPATGFLSKLAKDVSDVWTVDLKVPPVRGFIGQDWPATCLDWAVGADDQDYGCDLWIEVTNISEAPAS